MAEYVNGINPSILKWARESCNYTVQDTAASFKKDVSIIDEWESGERAPTYVQLEKLANKYKRPIAIFFFPEPPKETNIAEKLALRSSDIERLTPHIHILFRQASARQLSLMELNLGTNSSENKIFRDLQAQTSDSPLKLAKQARMYLDINIDKQTNWKDSTEALKIWRECIEEKGVFIFKDAFKDDSVDGFCLLHDEFPIIYLNNSMHPVRQIFSLFHELAHLLLGKNGITRGINLIGGETETFCNKFAAEFLVPDDDFEHHLNFDDYDDDAVEKLASYYQVSRPVILLKLVNKDILTYQNYLQRVKGWTALYELHKKKESNDDFPGGGSYYNTQATYLGYRYMALAFNKYHQGVCSIEELAEHLNVKVKQIPQFEERLLRRALR